LVGSQLLSKIDFERFSYQKPHYHASIRKKTAARALKSLPALNSPAKPAEGWQTGRKRKPVRAIPEGVRS
jgi:hypothetical protein